MRERTTSTRRFFARPSDVELVAIGSWLAKPATDIRRASTPLACEVADDRPGARAGELPVGWVLRAGDRLRVRVALDDDRVPALVAHDAGDLVDQLAGVGLSVASPESKKTLSVSSWMTRPRRRIVTLTLPFRPAPAESLSIRRLSARKSCLLLGRLLGLLGLGLRGRVVDRLDRAHRGQRRLDGRLVGGLGVVAGGHHRLAAAQDRPGERVLKRLAAAPRTSTCSPTRWRRAP